MSFYSNGEAEGDVALLAEGVDRNILLVVHSLPCCVALLAEGVDRNDQQTENHVREANVALLAEGVDRNKAAP